MGKFTNTWSIMGSCWELLKKDKELILFSFFSGICCLLVLASFVMPLYFSHYLIDASGSWSFLPPPLKKWATTNDKVIFYSILYMFYFCNYFVIIFFNSAIIACTTIRMRGGDPTLSDGFRASFSRLHLIFGWALVSASVGIILRIIEDRSERIGRFIAGLLGTVWTMASFLVIPILVNEEKGPFSALQKSTGLLKKTWGEQLIGNFSFGFVFFLLSIPAFLLLIFGFMSGVITMIVIGIILSICYLLVLCMVQATLQAIFQAVLYAYVSGEQVPNEFQIQQLKNSITAK